MPENKNKDKNNKKKNYVRYGILIIVALLCAILVFVSIKNNKDEKDKIYYTQLLLDINEEKIEKIEMTVGSKSIKAFYKDREEENKSETIIIPDIQAFVELIQDKTLEGNKIQLIQNPKNVILSVGEGLISFLPTIILASMVVMLIQMQGLGDKGKVYDPEVVKNKVTFKDIAGSEEEKSEVMEIVDFLKEPKKYTNMGAKIPKGVLLCGSPGTGKTLLARAIAGEANVPFISMSGSEFIEMFAGLGASRVRKLFERAKKVAPCIVFIDEIDAIGSRRASNNGADTENNQTLNQLLVEMDGFDTDTSVIVMAATNRPEMLDEALLRPGRFDRRINIGLPDINDREKILKLHAENKKLASDVDLKSVAANTAGSSGAELANVLNEAAILATNRNHEAITDRDVQDALTKVFIGLEKRSKVITEKDRKLTAYHEAGHAVVSKYLPTQDNIKEVSIIPRGVAGGYTLYKSNEDKLFVSKTEMEERMISLMGGRAAEKIALNDISTGASNDIEVAMETAKNMIVVYGMSERIGPMSINIERNPYGLEMLGNNLEDEIGKEVRKMLDDAYVRAQDLLTAHRDKLDAVARVLLEKEKITEQEFEEIFK